MTAELHKVEFYESNLNMAREDYPQAHYVAQFLPIPTKHFLGVAKVVLGAYVIADAYVDTATEQTAQPALDLLLDLTRARFGGE